MLAAQPESAGTARHFTREVLVSWGFGQLADEAETIIGELVVNAVQHGTRGSAGHGWRGSAPHSRGTNGYPRARARSAWASHLTDTGNLSAVTPLPAENAAGTAAGTAGAGPSGAGPSGAADSGVLRLCLLPRTGEVMLAVIDASDDAPAPRQPDWVTESGRGLQIVHALSSVWGWSPIEGHGKAVWAVLPCD